jgi:hypothetical protein
MKLSNKKLAEEIEILKESTYTRYAIKLYNDKINVGVIDDADVSLAYTGSCGDTRNFFENQ